MAVLESTSFFRGVLEFINDLLDLETGGLAEAYWN
jgi:hypothetical protein